MLAPSSPSHLVALTRLTPSCAQDYFDSMRQCRDHVRAVQESLPSPTPAAAAAAPAAPEQASGGAGLGKRRRSAATPAEERASSGRKGRRKHMSFELGELLEAEGKHLRRCTSLLCSVRSSG